MTVANLTVRQIILKRGNASVSNAYVGPVGEVTYDTSLVTLRVHDGVTPGGYIVPTQANVNAAVATSLPILANTIVPNIVAAELTSVNSNIAASNAQVSALSANLNSLVAGVSPNLNTLAKIANSLGNSTTIAATIGNVQLALTSEIARATGVENTLQNDLLAETASRTAANVLVTSALNNEANIRAATDLSLQANITAEEGLRAAADNALSTRITNLDNSLAPVAKTGTYSSLTGTPNFGAFVGNIVPNTDNLQYLGSAARRWHSLYVGPGSIDIGGVTISVVNGKIVTSTSFDLTGSDIGWNSVTGKPSFASVATSGAYGDLSGRPTNLSQFNNDTSFANVTYVNTQITNLINGAPGTLDTLNELGVAFQAADNNLLATINALTTSSNTAVANETAARIAADNSLQAGINNEGSARINADNILQTAVNNEANARIAADTLLQQNINIESNARVAADTLLQQNINSESSSRSNAVSALQASISNESSARTNADNSLQANITAEATARANADSLLQANITAETTARISADNSLQTNITAETTARASAVSSLQANITAEANARIASDTSLQSNITAETNARIQAVGNEANARIAADNSLQSNIDSLRSNLSIAAFTGNAVTIDITNTNGLTTTYYPTFVESRSSSQYVRADVDLTYRTDNNLLKSGNLQVGQNIYGSYLGGISNAIQLRPNIDIDKRFLFTVDSAGGNYLRSGMEMPMAEVNRASTLGFPHNNGHVGYIYSQGSDANGTEFNNAFNIMSNGVDLKLSAFNSNNKYIWTFDVNGNLTLPSSGYLVVTSGITSTGASPAPSISGFGSALFNDSLTVDDLNMTASNITVAANQTLNVNLSRTFPIAANTTMKFNLGGVETNQNIFSVDTAGGRFDFDGQSGFQRISFSDSSAYIKFGTSTRDGTGAANDIELWSYGQDNSAGNVYISAGSSPTNRRWRFSSFGQITFPDATIQSTAWTGISTWANLTGKPNFANIATSALYSDLTGVPTALSQFANDTNFANVTYVNTQITNLINGAPAALDTLNELGAAFQAADSNLLSAITSLTSSSAANLASETNARISADTSLQSNINSIAANLASETNARISADTSLQSNINSVAAKIGNVFANGLVVSNIVPATDVVYSIGTPTARFKDLYLSSNTIFLGEKSMSIDSSGSVQVTSELLGGEGIGGIAWVKWTSQSAFIIRIQSNGSFKPALLDIKSGYKFNVFEPFVQVITATGVPEFSGNVDTGPNPLQDYVIPVNAVTATELFIYKFNIVKALTVQDRLSLFANDTNFANVATVNSIATQSTGNLANSISQSITTSSIVSNSVAVSGNVSAAQFLGNAANVTGLATVAKTGQYSDLLGVPAALMGLTNFGNTAIMANVDVFPNANLTYSLGTNDYYWKNAFFGNVYATNIFGTDGNPLVSGYTGSRGVQGEQGIQGNVGFTGSQGIQGNIGFTGSRGVQGDTGFTGSQGEQGIQGNIGFTGSQGNVGFTGSQGEQGIQGNVGFTGSQGIQGNVGFTGSQGIQGNIGFTGSQGEQGIQGNIGFTGSQGIQGNVGFTGSQGVIGFTGSQGDLGYTGSRGDTGFTGSQGDLGYTGSRGATGLGFNIARTYANVAALTADTSPAGIIAGEFALINTGNVEDAENSRLYLWTGNTYTYVNDLSGAAGITGPQGTAGFTGSRGDTGFAGSQGVIGFTGSQGILGYTGSVGSAGFTGSQGDQGVTGFTGSVGAQGTQGNIGFTGSVGSQGTIGYTGSRGDQGAVGFTGSFGIQGNVGFTGSAGAQGVIGYTGSEGLQGLQGTTGFVGSQGTQGNIGFTGSQGEQGIQGNIGFTGSTGSQGTTGFTGSIGFTGSVGASLVYSSVAANTTAVVNTKYIIDTSAGNVVITLPSTPSFGQEVGVIDGTGNAGTNPITVFGNGSKIQGDTGNLTVSTSRAAFSLVYYNSAQGWILTNV